MIRNFKVCAYSACGLVLALSASALAQPAPKTLAENSKATVTESTLAVGATTQISSAPTGPFFARYYLTGGTLEYTYADGKKENVVRKAGSAVIISATDKRPASVKNVGTTALHIVTVSVK